MRREADIGLVLRLLGCQLDRRLVMVLWCRQLWGGSHLAHVIHAWSKRLQATLVKRVVLTRAHATFKVLDHRLVVIQVLVDLIQILAVARRLSLAFLTIVAITITQACQHLTIFLLPFLSLRLSLGGLS